MGTEGAEGGGRSPVEAPRRRVVGGLLIALGIFPLAFVPGFPDRGWIGVVVFAVEIALIVVGALIVWSARRS